MEFLNRLVSSKKKVLWFCFGLSLLLHFPFMNLPPQSIHVWRQCSTLTVARNLYEEGMNPFQPRIDQRFDTSGVTGMEFPIYQFIVALGYELMGEHNFVARGISFLIFMMGAWGVYELFFLLFNNRWAAALGAWSFCWSPELFYFGISALPDVLALSASIWGLYLFIRWFKTGGVLPFALSLVATTIGGLAKIQHLVIGFPIAAMVLTHKSKYKFSKICAMTFYAVVAVTVVVGWYMYAVHLIHISGLTDYDIGFSSFPGFSQGAQILWHNVHSEIPELILNYATFTFFVIGIYVCFRDRKWTSPWFIPFATYGIAVLAYYFIELAKMKDHSYYLLPFLPLLLIFVVWGALFLKDYKYRFFFIFFLVAQPTVAFFRIVPPRFWSKDKAVPMELYDISSRQSLINAVPNDKLCVVGRDDSRTIYFYYLHKKGFGFTNTSDLEALKNGEPILEDYIRRGAQYLYTNDPKTSSSKVLKPFLGSELLKEGNFEVFKLRGPLK